MFSLFIKASDKRAVFIIYLSLKIYTETNFTPGKIVSRHLEKSDPICKAVMQLVCVAMVYPVSFNAQRRSFGWMSNEPRKYKRALYATGMSQSKDITYQKNSPRNKNRKLFLNHVVAWHATDR